VYRVIPLPPFAGGVQLTEAEAFPAVAPTPVGAPGTAGEPEGSTSSAAKFQRSLVGAVSLSTTPVPGVAVGALIACSQKVSPEPVSTHSCCFTWLVPRVRAVA
jgi:hypothetical protein